MKIRKTYFILAILVLAVSGCEAVKTVLGTSTRALERARIDAIRKTYECDYYGCYHAVLSLDRDSVSYDTLDDDRYDTEKRLSDDEGEYGDDASQEDGGGYFNVFLQNRVKGHIVVMGIPGNVDTTEVGIFFARVGQRTTRIEISSLSSSAKRKVADKVFATLDELFDAKE